MLRTDQAVLVVIDVQDKLVGVMHRPETLLANIQKIIKGTQILEIPILWTEQYPEGLGPTVPPIAGLLSGIEPISKRSFSCAASERFMRALKATKRKQVLLAGIESHVCVYQTAVDLLGLGYEVQVVADAVSSRSVQDRHIALTKMNDAGASLTSTEIALFELLRVAEGPKFREILKIIK